MSEIDQAVEAHIARYRPDQAPPFRALKARRRRRNAIRGGAGAAAMCVAVVAALTVPGALSDGPAPDRLVQPPSSTASERATPSAPSVKPSTPGGKQAPSEADWAAYERWRAKGVPNYTMRLTRSCFCPSYTKLAVTVRDRKVVGSASTPRGFDPVSVDDLFAIILGGKADKFSVTYNDEYGYPESLALDQIVNAIDDEVTYRISDYRPAGR
jgi:hypothetical protein